MLLDCVTEIRGMQKLIETELHSSITMIESLVRHMSQMDSEIKQLKSQLASKDKQISELSFEDAEMSSPKRTVMYTSVKYLQQPMDDFKTPPKSKVSKERLNEPSISDQYQHQTKTDTGLQAPATSAAKKTDVVHQIDESVNKDSGTTEDYDLVSKEQGPINSALK